MKYFPITTSHFEKQFSKLTKKNAVFKGQAAKKIKGIVLNPEIGAPKTHKLRGLRSLHITDRFVVVYIIFKDLVIFVEIDHHDKAYRAVEGVVQRLIEDEKLLTALQRMGITTDEFAHFMKAIGLRGQ
jgi:mRNA-degrading endonuclease RelE of RelBE toxin-antitoxin system